MGTAAFLREQFKQAHNFLEATMNDVTGEQAQWAPPGTANPLGATYAHIAISEDAMLNGMVKGGAPLMVGEWGPKMGVSSPPPAPGQGSWDEWANSVQVDLPKLREYAKAVYKSTDDYLASLDDAGLDKELDLSGFQLGKQSAGWFMSNILLSHVSCHWGEVSCLKGMQGAKGYPF